MKGQDIRFGGRLRSERVRLGLTQAELAEVGGVSKTTQVAYEANVHRPDVAYLAAVSAIGVDEVFVLHARKTSAFVCERFNWQLFEELLEIVEEWAASRSRKTPASVKVALIQLLYAQFCSEGSIDRQVVARTLALAA